MADVSKSGTPSIATLGPIPGANKLPTLTAGEALAAGDACYIKSDGKVWKSTGAAANAAAKVDGFTPYAVASGETVTLFFNLTLNYGSGLTPGASYFLSGATAGALADAASTGGTAPVAFAIDATRVYVFQSRY